MSLLEGKTAFVTGAASENGIGFAACRCLVEAGANVVVTDLARNSDERSKLDARVAELRALGGEALACALDVTSLADAEAATKSAVERFGRIDILFNNAGSGHGVGPFLEMTDEEFDVTWRVNFMGTVNMCRAVIPQMQVQGSGSVINNSSLAGIGSLAKFAGYSSSKFAVVGLTKVLAAEFGGNNIRVNAVCPGLVWTDMGRQEVEFLRQPSESFEDAKQAAASDVSLQQRWADPREIGNTVVYLGSELASYVSGVALPVAGALAPGL
jgi:3-oxoacyl-[acyl-carrier protein] reductase